MMAALYLRKNVRGVLIRQNHYHSPNGIYSPVLVLHILRSPGYLSYDLHGSQACRINHNIANIVRKYRRALERTWVPGIGIELPCNYFLPAAKIYKKYAKNVIKKCESSSV